MTLTDNDINSIPADVNMTRFWVGVGWLIAINIDGLDPSIFGWGRKAWDSICYHDGIAPLKEDS